MQIKRRVHRQEKALPSQDVRISSINSEKGGNILQITASSPKFRGKLNNYMSKGSESQYYD
jgi:hypothetical protein